jgi:hypothetical protein
MHISVSIGAAEAENVKQARRARWRDFMRFIE